MSEPLISLFKTEGEAIEGARVLAERLSPPQYQGGRFSAEYVRASDGSAKVVGELRVRLTDPAAPIQATGGAFVEYDFKVKRVEAGARFALEW